METFEDDDDEDARHRRAFGSALKSIREQKGISQREAGVRFGVDGGQGWYKYESGSAMKIFFPEIQRRLATALDVSVEELLAEKDRFLGAEPEPQTAMVIRRRVQAGAWLAVDDLDQASPRTYPHPRDPRFPFAHQWLSEVVGDSMDAVPILEGDLVHCVDIIDIGYHPRTGDIVEVERRRFQGREVEVSLKQVEVRGSAIFLWPRSTNERWKDPLTLRAGVGETEEFEIAIKGLVLSAIRRFHSI